MQAAMVGTVSACAIISLPWGSASWGQPKWPGSTSGVRQEAHPVELLGSRSPAFGNSSKIVPSWSRSTKRDQQAGATSCPVSRLKEKSGFHLCCCIAQARRIRSNVRCQSASTEERPHVSATDRSPTPQNGAAQGESREEAAVPLSDSEGEEATPPMPWPVSPEKVPELRPPAEPSPEIVAAAAKAASAALDDLKACQSAVDGECSVEQAVVEESEGRLVVELIRQLEMIRLHALDLEEKNQHFLQAINSRYTASGQNLLHYLALRSSDIRDIQGGLASLGLSSLGRTEAHTLGSITAVLRVLQGMARGQPAGHRQQAGSRRSYDFEAGNQQLQSNTEALLGPKPKSRNARIMVTMPAEAADDGKLVSKLLSAGMNCARVNTAHDDAAVWGRILATVQRCSGEAGKECRIFMDLAGPKLRTGALQPGPRVASFGPQRDVRGRDTEAAKLWLAPPGVAAPHGSHVAAVLPVEPPEWVHHLQPGDRVHVTDLRGKEREWTILPGGHEGDTEDRGGRLAECWKTTYVEAGTALTHVKEGAQESPLRATARIVGLAPREYPIILARGDTLVLTRDPAPGMPAVRDTAGAVVAPARVGCTLPKVFATVQPGEPIKLDDGKIEGFIRRVTPDEMEVEITRAKDKGSKLKADKAINLPESDLQVDGLTPKDIADLDFIAQHADMVGFSFVNEPEDVQHLQRELHARRADHVGIVLKIETKRAFQKLPWLLLTCMQTANPIGVMIARGDLAVEIGWERLAEIQEEILWLCEAAHVPVIWATQVLEGLAKLGLPSRAEITDAAMGERAECVMLNKGPHIVAATSTLHDILKRMHSHQKKKRALLRSLKVSRSLENPALLLAGPS